MNEGNRKGGKRTEKPQRGTNRYLRDRVGRSQKERSVELGRGERTIQDWDAKDKELAKTRPAEKAAPCQGDHPWMLPGSQLEGYGFAVVTGEESPEETEADPPSDPGRPIVRRTYTCVSCGYRRVERTWAVIV